MRLALLLALACVALPAMADDLLPTKSFGVLDRPRPEYDPRGVKVGDLVLRPELTLGASHDDNIYSTRDDAVSDQVAEVGAGFNLQSEGSRLTSAVQGKVASRLYDEYSDENTVDWLAGASLGSAFGARSSAKLQTSFSHDHETRDDPSSPVNAIEPTRFETIDALAGLTHQFASAGVDVTAEYRNATYNDAKLADGARLDQGFKDRDTLQFTARGAYRLRESTVLFLKATRMDLNYRERTPGDIDRDSVSTELSTGAGFGITNLMRGEIGVGVLDLDNQDPTQRDRRSLAIQTNVELFLTQLVSARLDAKRTSGAADLAGSASFIGTDVSVSVDYEMRRNLILSARAAHSERDYTGIESKQTTRLAGVEARWLLNRNLNVELSYTHQKRDAPVPELGRSFTQGVVTCGIRLLL